MIFFFIFAVFFAEGVAVPSASEYVTPLLSSSSYKLDSNSFAYASIYTNSMVYKIFASLQEQPASVITSSSFSMGTGFSKTVYPSSLGPMVLSIDPSSGYNIAPVKINKITGANFSSGMTVKLTSTTEADITASHVSVVSSSEITCTLDISGARAGMRTILVSGEGITGATLNNAFEIKTYSFDLSLALNSPNPFDPAREKTTVIFNLSKDTDVNAYIFTITGDLIWKNNFMAGSSGGKAGENSFTWDGISNFGEMMSNGVYLLHLVERVTGRTVAKGKIAIIRRTS
jgi:hypothetical protein